MWTVSLANQRTFSASAETSILEAARIAGLALEHSCRTGRCGVCKAKVVSGPTRILRDEIALDACDRESGFILTCCRSAIGPLDLDTEDLGDLAHLPVRTLPVRVEQLQALAPDVMRVLLRLPAGSGLRYLPGQYIEVIAHGGIRRSYSIANSPREDDKLELHVRLVPGGTLSQYWFHSAKVNDLLRINGPLGTFVIRENVNANLVFLATGTGIAPVKAMLEFLASEGRDPAGIRVYWGGRTRADHYLDPVPHGFNVRLTRVMSRMSPNCPGERGGYVQQVVVNDGLPLHQTTVFACGSDAMIHSARTLLTTNGLGARHFHSDAFVSSN